MKEYYYEVDFGLAGTESSGILEAEDDEQAAELAYQHSIDNAESFGFFQEEPGDQVIKRNDDEDDEDYEEGDLDFFIELYNPQKHDHLI